MSANDAIQSLARLSQASARLMAAIHLSGKPRDVEHEIEHMQANLDHVRAQIEAETRR